MKKWNELHPVKWAKEMPFKKIEKAIEESYALNDHNIWDLPKYKPLEEWLDLFLRIKEFRHYGQNVFVVNQNLQDLLLHTTIENINGDSIKLPYDGFFIAFEKNKLNVDGVYIRKNKTDYEPPFYSIELDFVIGKNSSHYWINSDRDVLSGITNSMEDIWFDDVCIERGKQTLDSDILDYIKLTIGTLLYLSLPKNDIVEKLPEDLPIHLKKGLEDADTKRRKEKAEQAIKDAGYTKIKYVGQSFKGIATGTGGEMATHWRRGHWANIACGKGRQERQLIWRMPTIINGHKGEPTKGHLYEA